MLCAPILLTFVRQPPDVIRGAPPEAGAPGNSRMGAALPGEVAVPVCSFKGVLNVSYKAVGETLRHVSSLQCMIFLNLEVILTLCTVGTSGIKKIGARR